MVTEKYCKDCGGPRPATDFSSDRRRADGLSFYCRSHARRRLLAAKDARQGPPRHRHRREIHVPDGFKWCPDCALIKPIDEFVRNSSQSSKRGAYCKPCHNARGKASKDKVGGSRTYHLKRRYGITAKEADALLAAQGGLCAICRAAPAVHVDHDHATDEVRELLCFNCNGGLGQFRDDPAVLRAAAEYVERHRDQQRRDRPRPLAWRRPEVTVRAGSPPVGSQRRPSATRRTGLCSRGRALLAAREADA